MMLRVTEDLTRAGQDREVRAVVIRGQGKVFSAGHNLKEMTVEFGYEHHKRVFDTCEEMMRLVGQVLAPAPAPAPRCRCL
jgi:enoyl-CoA hydratase/carnithine racemase